MLLPLIALALMDPSLLAGVTTVAKPGIPGVVYALDSRATPFLVGETGSGLRAVAVAGHAGKGRVVAFGHDGYLGEGTLAIGDTRRMMQNAIRWAAGKERPRVGYLHVEEPAIRQLGFDSIDLAVGDWRVDVVVGAFDGPNPKRLRDLLKKGGGVVAAVTPWGWQMVHPGKRLWRDQAFSPVLADAGIAFGDGMVDSVRPIKDKLEAQSLTVTKDNPAMIAEVVRNLGPKDPLRTEAETITRNVKDVVPTEKNPLGPKQGLERLALVLRQMRFEQGETRGADPAAVDFPGAVPKDAPRVTREVSVWTDAANWQGTGLYAAPGEEVAIRFRQTPPSGMRLQIGIHSDELWGLDTWKRNPSIVTSAPIQGRLTRLRNPFGGLIYVAVDTPRPGSTLSATVSNAVEAPRYIHGKTTDEEWKRQQTFLGPWAEFEANYVIVTVPTQIARGVENPKELTELWNRTMNVFAEFDGYYPNRPERIVADRQISAGYMHSGYPIMTWMDVCDLVTNPKRLTTEGSWGHWHELGHNRQRGAWTFEGTGEVTNNLFTMLAMQRNAGKGVWDRLGPVKEKQLPAYLKAGAPFEKWQSDPFLALTMYAQLIDAFGWDALSRVIKGYPAGVGDDWSEERKRDEWMIRCSKDVGRNLGPFFVAWGVPTSEKARKSLEGLPAWMPVDWPKQL